MELVEAWKFAVLKNYANFEGRNRRTPYWMFFLANLCVNLTVAVIFWLLAATKLRGVAIIFFFLSLAYAIVMLIPGLAATVRRLHDIGKSGWFILISIVPLVGGIILLIFLLQKSDPGPNKYGPEPPEFS